MTLTLQVQVFAVTSLLVTTYTLSTNPQSDQPLPSSLYIISYALLSTFADHTLYTKILTSSNGPRLFGIGLSTSSLLVILASISTTHSFGSIEIGSASAAIGGLVLLARRESGREHLRGSLLPCTKPAKNGSLDYEPLRDISAPVSPKPASMMDDPASTFANRIVLIVLLSILFIGSLLLPPPAPLNPISTLASLHAVVPHTPPKLASGVLPAILGETTSLASFLAQRITPSPEKTIWLTVADEAYAKKAVRHLGIFLDRINQGKPSSERDEMVVLCLDEGCVNECNKRGEFGYAGYMYTVDPTMQTSNEHVQLAVWTKLNGGPGSFLTPSWTVLMVDVDERTY
jgi:hypothetical protein